MNRKLCLGTVQFGLDYGINNKAGKPSKQNSFEMLDIARDAGIDIFDTAIAYGTAEELLGEYIKERKCKEKVKVISKLRPNLIEEGAVDTPKMVIGQIKESLNRMKLDQLEGYLLHTPNNFYNAEIIEGLLLAKEQGLVKNIGVSIYEYQHALDVVKSEKMDFIQVPYSVFDQRVDTEEFFENARKNGVTVFGRSAFLQGLLAMDLDEIPEHLSHAREYLKIYDGILKKYELNRIEGAFKFALGQKGIDYVVFGVDNSQQLREDILIANNESEDNQFIDEVKKVLQGIEKSVIFPSLWLKK